MGYLVTKKWTSILLGYNTLPPFSGDIWETADMAEHRLCTQLLAVRSRAAEITEQLQEMATNWEEIAIFFC